MTVKQTPEKIKHVSSQIAKDITFETVCQMWGGAAQAAVALSRMKLTSPFLENASALMTAHVAQNPELREQIAKMQKASEGLDPYTFPAQAPAPSFTPPGDKLGAPAEPAQPIPDDGTLPGRAPRSNFSPPGDSTGTPPNNTPTEEEEQDKSTFPDGTAPPAFTPHPPAVSKGKDLNTTVTPGPQPPETERHNPDLHKKQEEAVRVRPPWESRATPAASSNPGLNYSGAEDDGHVRAIEQCGQEVDLYHKRYAKKGGMSDLNAQATSFKAEREAMCKMTDCVQHIDDHRAYAKEVFAYSFGQVKRSLSKALRNFAESDDAPDVATYHEVQALRADLLGEASSRHFAQAKLPLQLANYMADDDEPDDDDKPGTRPPAEAQKSKKEDDDDMKEEDVKAGIDIAHRLVEAGLINDDQRAEYSLRLAKMDSTSREEWVAMTAGLNGGGPSTPPNVDTFQHNTASGRTAEKNMVGAGIRPTVGGEKASSKVNLTNLFTGGKVAPMRQQ